MGSGACRQNARQLPGKIYYHLGAILPCLWLHLVQINYRQDAILQWVLKSHRAELTFLDTTPHIVLIRILCNVLGYQRLSILLEISNKAVQEAVNPVETSKKPFTQWADSRSQVQPDHRLEKARCPWSSSYKC